MRAHPRGAASLLLSATLVLSAGCTSGGQAGPSTGESAASGPASRSPAPTAESRQVGPEERRRIAQQILDRRARAVREEDREAFLADVDLANRKLVNRQHRLFANLVRLPLQRYELTASTGTIGAGFADPRWADSAFIPYVEETIQLEGFDPIPVTNVYGITFARRGDRWLIVADDDVADRVGPGVAAPWRLTPITVRRTDRVLGLFDEGSRAAADRVLDWSETAIETVAAAVPTRWSRRVVVHALSDPRMLTELGRRFEDIAAVAFPVFENSESGGRLVSMRVLIHPDRLMLDDAQGQFLLTHEITHVATGQGPGRAPVWMTEGLAEYVAASGLDDDGLAWRPLPYSVSRARAGVTRMPASPTFDTDDPKLSYDLSHMAVAYIAERFGKDRLWRLHQAMKRYDGVRGPDDAQDRVLRREIGMTSAELARRAARRLVEAG